MHDVFAASQLRIKRDRRPILVIGLNIDYPSFALSGDLAKMPYQLRRDTSTSKSLIDSQIVNVDFPPLLFELV